MTNGEIEKQLWDVANDLRANSKLTAQEYSTPVLGLIFLRHADFKFSEVEKDSPKKSGRRTIGKNYYISKGVLYLPEKARYSYLLSLPEGSDIGQEINSAMELIEKENKDLEDVLPKTYTSFSNDLLVALLKAFSKIVDMEGDAFGKIYEYFLGKFAMTEGQKGGEFFTPTSIVKLIVEIIEPYHGKIFDPACGSGGMFVQSAHFVEKHKKRPSTEIHLYGQERVTGTVNLCKMNLAVHGLSSEGIREGNSYYEDIHNSVEKFDFVMANPPFNVKKIDYEKIKGDSRWNIGIPSTDNGNYIWIQQFWSALNEKGRSGFVMADSAADARGNETEIRKELIKMNAIDVMIRISSNFFYTVTLSCTLWFLDKDKTNTDRTDKILFIDARHIFKQIDRAHREFTPEQVDKIAGIVRSYRKEKGAKPYGDVKGLCKITSIKDIEEQGWSLNPGRYVGVADKVEEDYDFKERLEEYNEELQELTAEAHELEVKIAENVNKLLRNN